MTTSILPSETLNAETDSEITENGEVSVVRGENELSVALQFPDALDHFLVDGLAVQIVFRLIDQNKIMLFLAQEEQHHGGRTLTEGMRPQGASVIGDLVGVRHLIGEKIGSGLQEVFPKCIRAAAGHSGGIVKVGVNGGEVCILGADGLDGV